MEQPTITSFAYLALLAMFLYGMSEMIWLTLIKKRVSFRHDFFQPLRNFVGVNIVTVLFLPVLSAVALAIIASELSSFTLGNAWYVWLVALLIYEFWYWVQHFLAHKVRLLWCIHSPHHAPDTINMVVGYNHHLLEAPYMAFFAGFMPAMCGVPLEMIIVINMVDIIWGSMLHASPGVISKKYGFLERFLQTPSYHRAHHAKNPLYIDTNYNSITLFWDWALGTLQPLRDEVPIQYGITRNVNVESWSDVQFGEMAELWQDVKRAPGLKNKLAYLLLPPGWSHTGEHKMASTMKQVLR